MPTRSTLVLIAAVLASACDSKPAPPPAEAPAPPPPAERSVILRTTGNTWRANASPHNAAADLIASLAGKRVAVVPEGGKADAIAMVTMEEEKGAGYAPGSPWLFLDPTEFGTRFVFTLTLESAKDGSALLHLEARAETPSTVKNDTPYNAGVASLRATPQYGKAALFVAAALGVPSALPETAAAAVPLETRAIALPLLDRAGYSPARDEERACLAIARGDVPLTVELRHHTLPLLHDLLEKSPGDHGILPSVRAVGSIGDPKSSFLLVKVLGYARGEHNVREPDDELAVAALEALGACGNDLVLPAIQPFEKDETPEVARAAVQARERILEREKKGR